MPQDASPKARKLCDPRKDKYKIFFLIYFIFMSSLTLDGSTRIIGTEFIKLLATGNRNLATVEYVDDAVAGGGGGGGGGGADLTNYYNKTETDALLNNKYNKTEADTLLLDDKTECK